MAKNLKPGDKVVFNKHTIHYRNKEDDIYLGKILTIKTVTAAGRIFCEGVDNGDFFHPIELTLFEEHLEKLTVGQKLVGLTFNPSGDENVVKAKELFADVIDLLEGFSNDKVKGTALEKLYDMAMGAVIMAQMAVVKVLTWKD